MTLNSTQLEERVMRQQPWPKLRCLPVLQCWEGIEVAFMSSLRGKGQIAGSLRFFMSRTLLVLGILGILKGLTGNHVYL